MAVLQGDGCATVGYVAQSFLTERRHSQEWLCYEGMAVLQVGYVAQSFLTEQTHSQEWLCYKGRAGGYRPIQHEPLPL